MFPHRPEAFRPRHRRAVATLAAAFAAHAALPAATPHVLTGPVENPEFINSDTGTDLLWSLGYYGRDIIIANVEGGHVWSGHQVFDRSAIAAALGIALPASPARLINAPASETAPELGELDYRATMVGHVLVGASTIDDGAGGLALTSLGAGAAPLATLWSGAIATTFDKTEENAGSFEITPESFRFPYLEFFTGGVSGVRADVLNGSWGGADPAARADETRFITAMTAQNPAVAAVFSAGNSGPAPGTVGLPAASPNVISVGSVGGPDRLDLSEFSSSGPVPFYHPGTDTLVPAARAAVHVVAPGENLILAAYLQPTGGLEPLLTPETTTTAADYYFLSASGTSFSAPLVAGGIALVKDYIKHGPDGLPQTEALDTRVLRSVIMASATPTHGWDNAQNPIGPGGSLLTTQALDHRAGAGRFDASSAAALYVAGTRDVPGLAGGSGLAPEGWDHGAISLGQVNDYTLDLDALLAPARLDVALNWFVDDHYDAATESLSYGSFANLDLEVWALGAGGDFDLLLAASRTAYDTTEFLRFEIAPGHNLGLRVRFDGVVYDFDGLSGGAVTYGLAWSLSPIPEPATAALLGLLALAGATLRRRRPHPDSKGD